MSGRFTTELKVGVFVIAALVILFLGFLLTRDGLWPPGRTYTVSVVVPSAEGLYVGTPVRLAGVQIGTIETIGIEGQQARLELGIDRRHRLPVDSTVEVRTTGLLGDRFVAILLGQSSIIVADGGVLVFGRQPGDIDAITRQVEQITADVQAITNVVRAMVEDRQNQEHVERTLENTRILSAELRMMAQENREDIRQVVQGVRRLAESLEAFSDEARQDVRVQMEKLHDATDRLDDSLGSVQTITGRIERGEGTLGALINDPTTVHRLNEALEDMGGMFGGFRRIRGEVYYLGRLYVGTQPSRDIFFYGNPLAPSLSGAVGYGGANNIGIRLRTQEDLWWTFELNDTPQGRIRLEERFFPEEGFAITEYTRRLTPRFSVMMSKRWWDLAFRVGVIEGSGGLGASWFTLDDRLEVRADVFDFRYGAYPAIRDRGIPNLRVGVRATPISNVWAEAGAEQVLLGLRYGYVTGYLGAGLHFTDDNIRVLFGFLPGGL